MSFQGRRSRQGDAVRQPRLSDGGGMFRRSRTLTGSISSRVASAVETASNLKSPRLEEHELRGHRRRLGVWLFGVVVLAAGTLWLLDSWMAFAVPSPLAEPYQGVVDSYYATHPLERFAFWRNNLNLLDYVQTSHPEVEQIAVAQTSGIARYTLDVTLRTPVAKWVLGGRTYYVDTNGVAYEFANQVTTGPLVQVRDDSGLPLASQQVASRRTMQFIGQVVAQVKARGAMNVSEVILPAGTLKEIDIVLQDRPYHIKLNIDREPVGQAIDIVHAIGYLDTHGLTPRYVDARVEGKAFFQ